MMMNKILAIFLINIFLLLSCFNSTEGGGKSEKSEVNFSNTVKYAGVRSSYYGINPFPSNEQWGEAINKMSSYFKNSRGGTIWIIGDIDINGNCVLEFPGNSSGYNNILFESTDKHESYLFYFDDNNIDVFLQVESGLADVEDLIDIVISQYGAHPCVGGFGIDVEWYQSTSYNDMNDDYPNYHKISDSIAEKWELKIKSYNSHYRLFLKHWDYLVLPPNYRGDIIFVNDGQNQSSLSALLEYDFKPWIDRYKKNALYFQIGYSSDKPWWSQYDVPPQVIGNAIDKLVKQECGIFWVDFTLKDVLL